MEGYRPSVHTFMDAAREGDRITWGDEDSEPTELKIGKDYALERIVDGLAEAEWIAREYNTNYLAKAEELQEQVTEGRIDAEYRDWQLQQIENGIRGHAEMLFGDPTAELDEYSRELSK